MPLVIKDTDHVPPEGFWQYPIPETSYTVQSKHLSRLYPEILTHCQSNKVTPPSEQDVIDCICKNQRVPCYESQNREPLINLFTRQIPKPPPVGCCGQRKAA